MSDHDFNAAIEDAELLQMEVDRLNSNESSMRELIEAQRQEIEELRTSNAELLLERDICHAKITELRAGKNIEFIDAEIERLQGELERLRAFYNEAVTTLENRNAEIGRLRADKQNCDGAYAIACAEIERLQGELERLQEDSDRQWLLEAEVERLRGELERLQEESDKQWRKAYSKLEAENERLHAALDLPPQLTKEQEQQLSSGYGAILSPVDVFRLGWKTGLSEARRALEPMRAP